MYKHSHLPPETSTWPRVFVLGENERMLDHLFTEHSGSLLEVCDNNMEKAYKHWLNMLKKMEDYATEIDFDLKGIKLWIHVFFNSDGTIKHTGYYLRPKSRNMQPEDLYAFFSSFMRHHRMPVQAETPFRHYTSVSFPLFSLKISKNGE